MMTTKEQRKIAIKAKSKLRAHTARCADKCPGWAVFQADAGFEIQACDECWSGVKGPQRLTDDEAACLPEALESLKKEVAAYCRESDKACGISQRGKYGLYECVEEISVWMRSLGIPGVPGLSGEEADDLQEELEKARAYMDQHHPAGVH